MTSFQDAPDENIEHDEKMELRSSSFNIEYQSTGVGSLPFLDLDEIEPIQNMGGFFLSTYGNFWWPFSNNNFFLNSGEKLQAPIRSKKIMANKYNIS